MDTQPSPKKGINPIIILVLIFLIPVLCIGGFVLYSFAPKTVSGYVYDCDTGERISDVQVEVNNRWLLTWETNHIYPTVSSQSGEYKITYTIGSSAHLRAHKDGYLETDFYSYPAKKVNIGMKRQSEVYDTIYKDCKSSSECVKSEIAKDGSTHIRNICN